MSDFDKFFADKLDQEDHYPGRAKNWRALHKRLDAFSAGSAAGAQASSVLWKSITATLLVTSVLLVSKYISLQRHFQHLKQEQQYMLQQIAQLQQQPYAPASTTPPPATPAFSGNQDSTPAPAPHRQTDEAMPITSRRTPVLSAKSDLPTPSPAAATSSLSDRQDAATPAPADLTSHAATTSSPMIAAAEATPVLPLSTPSDPVPPSSIGEKTTPLPLPSAPPSADTRVTSLPDSVAAPVPAVALPVADTAVSPVFAEVTPAAPPPSDTTARQTPPPAVVAEHPFIRPLRRSFSLRAGASLLTGWDRPHRLGISPLRGQGLAASVSLWRSRLWLTSGMDWLKFQEDSPTYWAEYHASLLSPKYKGGPGHSHSRELVRVQSTQRHQRFQLGLRYELPSLWRIRPTVQAGHVWLRTEPTYVRYTFEDNDPGPNPGSKVDSYTLPDARQKHSGIWVAGAGLEYDLRHWTLSVRADYQAQGRAHTLSTFDVLLLRAGLDYRIR